MRKRYLCLAYLIAAFLLSHWFFHSGVLSKVDTLFHLNRIAGLCAGLAAGDLPVYLHGYQMLGYGTADGALYPDALLYVPAVLHLSGVSLAASYHAYWVLVVFLGLAAAWRGYTLFFGRAFPGLVAAMLFHSSYFLLFCLGTSVGAYVAIGFLPYAFGSLYALLRGVRGARVWPELALAFTVIAESHVINTLFFLAALPLCLLFWRRGLCDGQRRRGIFLAACFSLLLNLWRLVPFAFFYRGMDFHLRHPQFASLATMTSDLRGLFDAQFWWGWPLVLLMAAGACSPALRRRRAFLLTLLLCALLTFFISSAFPWPLIEQTPFIGPLLAKFQLSMRALPLGLVPLSFFLARWLCALARRLASVGGCLSLSRALALGCAFVALADGMWSAGRTDFVMGGIPIRWRVAYEQAEPLPSYGARVQPDYVYADVDPVALFSCREVPAPDEVRPVEGKVAVTAFRKQGTHLTFLYEAPAGATVQVPLFFYPGYEVRAKGQPVAATEGAHHVLTLCLPAGSGDVSVRYRGPAAFRWSFRASLVSLVLFLFLWTRWIRRA